MPLSTPTKASGMLKLYPLVKWYISHSPLIAGVSQVHSVFHHRQGLVVVLFDSVILPG